MKNAKLFLACVVILGVLLFTVSFKFEAPLAQAKQPITAGAAPKSLPFSDGILAGNTLYVSGMEGNDEQGKLRPGGIGPETQAALDNIEKVLKAAGFEMKDLVSVNVYLADIREFGDMNQVYKGKVPDPKPTRATVQVAGLVNNAHVEISAIAVKQK